MRNALAPTATLETPPLARGRVLLLLRDHTGIGLNTPADVHYGLATAKATERAAVLAAARARNPERFATTQDPNILSIPTTAWINKPADNTGIELAA